MGILICSMLLVVLVVVASLRRHWTLAQGMRRLTDGAVLVVGVLLAVLIITGEPPVPESAIADTDLAIWAGLAGMLGERIGGATSGRILVVEPIPMPLQELHRLSEARQQAFFTHADPRRCTWQVPRHTGRWVLDSHDMDLVLPDGPQADLLILWNLAPPVGWARRHQCSLVIIASEDHPILSSLARSGELVCAITPTRHALPPGGDPKSAWQIAFTIRPTSVNDPVWRVP